MMNDHITYFVLKSSVLVPLFIYLPFTEAFLAMMFVVWAYQYLIALVLGLRVMPTSDFGCFLDTKEGRVNFMSATVIEKLPFESAKKRFERLM